MPSPRCSEQRHDGELNLTLLATRSTEEGSYYRLGPQPRHRLQALVDLAAVYDWRAISAVVDVDDMATGAYLVYVDVKREREVLKDLMKHQKRTLGRRLSSLGSRLGLKVPEEDLPDDEEGPRSPLASGRA